MGDLGKLYTPGLIDWECYLSRVTSSFFLVGQECFCIMFLLHLVFFPMHTCFFVCFFSRCVFDFRDHI